MRKSRDSGKSAYIIYEGKDLKVNLGNTKVIVSGGITKDGMSKSKVDPCGVCSMRGKTN